MKNKQWALEHPQNKVPAEIYNHKNLVDCSWCNDMCSSFDIVNQDDEDKTGFVFWCDYEQVEQRDWQELAKRYSIVQHFNLGDEGEPIRIFESESLIEALQAIQGVILNNCINPNI